MSKIPEREVGEAWVSPQATGFYSLYCEVVLPTRACEWDMTALGAHCIHCSSQTHGVTEEWDL